MPTVQGKEVGPIGYGLMGFTWRAEPVPETQCIEAMETALANGSNFWNGGEIYGTPSHNSLHILRAYFEKHPEARNKIVISIKGGSVAGELRPDGSPENIRRSVDECLRVLDGKKELDIFECARMDPNYTTEEIIGSLATLVKEGKFKGISLSEVDAETIRRAAKLHPIAAVEVELSLWDTTILKNGVASTCKELGIPIIAYSPLGRGALSGRITKLSDIPEGDIRRHLPRFQEEALAKNLKFVDEVKAFAARKNMTPAQFSLTWIKSLSNSPDMPTIIPIPGATTKERIVENLKDLPPFSADEMKEIENMINESEIVGGRY